LKLDPIRSRNLTYEYANGRCGKKRARTAASGKLFAKRPTPGGRRFHGFTERRSAPSSTATTANRVSRALVRQSPDLYRFLYGHVTSVVVN
jgi:hypothetical protein